MVDEDERKEEFFDNDNKHILNLTPPNDINPTSEKIYHLK